MLRLGSLAAVLVIGFIVVANDPAGAADLRGRVDAVHRYSSTPFPAHGVEVRLVSPRFGGAVGRARTGPDGIYYLYGISPGSYDLEVRRSPKEHPSVYALEVRDVPQQDVRPILLRY
jgi:hypothetical protein